MPRRTDLQHVLVIGSGPIVIGQACEFDYSGTQACRVLRAEGLQVSLVNSNPATIMTDPEFADHTYVEPITPAFVERVIAQQAERGNKIDALLATLGGQTALNTAVALYENGVLEKLRRRADRRRLRGHPARRGPAAVQGHRRQGRRRIRPQPSRVSPWTRSARRSRSWVCRWWSGRRSPWAAWARAWRTTAEDVDRMAGDGLAASPCANVLIEESIYGWKEFELELMRDGHDNVVVVCSIENVDPMGVHTGDSVTVAPAMTLTDREYQRMRDLGIAILREVGVDTGGCNIQFAVNPADGRLIVIEMNPRVSRSSRAGVEGHRLPDRQDRRQARHRLHPRRDPQRHHQGNPGLLRADAGLRRGQGAAVRVREVPRRRPDADHHDEVRRRGDVVGPQLHRGARQGDAVAGDQPGRLLDGAGPRRRHGGRC